MAHIGKGPLQSLNKVRNCILGDALEGTDKYICVGIKTLNLFGGLYDLRNPRLDRLGGLAPKRVHKLSNTWSAQFQRPLVRLRIELEEMSSPYADGSTVGMETFRIEATAGYDQVETQNIHSGMCFRRLRRSARQH